MAIYPVQFFTQENVRVRRREDYKSRPLVEKSLGHPKGVYLGFIPSAGLNDVTLAPDPVRGVSNLKVPSSADPGGMDITYTDPVVLDFSSALPGELPAYVIATASYDRAGSTTGEITVRTIPQTTGLLLYTVGAGAEIVDLGDFTLPSTPIRPSTVQINVTNSISGPTTITDDGRGNLVGPDGLESTGTVDYRTGELSGLTAPLAPASTVTVDYEDGILPTECLICIVDGPPGALSVRADEPFERTTPIARAGVPYGFMPAGTIETLSTIIDIVNEVVAARVDLLGTTRESLSARLAEDAGAPAMAGRLAPVLRLLRSNDHAGVEGESEIIVGGSFTAINRDFLPKFDLPAGGSETQLGAVTDPPRNRCVVVNADSGYRLVDDASRALVFGRVGEPETTPATGTLTFTQASDVVTGVGSSFTTSFQPGDLVAAPDGRRYEVEVINSDTELELRDAYVGETAEVEGPDRIRYILNLRMWDAEEESEVDYDLAADTTIRFFFPAFVDQSESAFDTALFLHGPGEKVPLPSATVDIPGHVRLAEPTALLGSVNIQEDGLDLGKFHSIDFTAAGGSVDETEDGVITVGEIGPVGPTGPTGVSGGTGPTGAQGESYDAFNLWQANTEEEYYAPAGGATAVHAVNMGHEVRAVYGWFNRVRAQGGTSFDDNDEVEINTVQATGQVATIECSVTGLTRVRLTLYLSSAGIAP